MNAAAIFALIEQGLTLLPTLVQAGIDISQHIQQLTTLAKAGQAGTIDPAELAAIRSSFDTALDSFNAPMA
jgi:hypothetical protein